MRRAASSAALPPGGPRRTGARGPTAENGTRGTPGTAATIRGCTRGGTETGGGGTATGASATGTAPSPARAVHMAGRHAVRRVRAAGEPPKAAEGDQGPQGT